MADQKPLHNGVTMPDGVTYSPYGNLKRPDLRYAVPGNVVSTTLKSTVVVTSTGRIVYVPKR